MTKQQNASDRLPEDMEPLVYDVRIALNTDNDTYTGDVTLTAKTPQPTNTLTLHAHEELAIGNITVTQFGKTQKPIKKHHDPNTDHLTLTFKRQLQVGTIVLRVSPFSGVIRDDLVGFYRSTYKVGEQERKLYVSQFEPTHARRALPLRDELADKAVYNVTLDVPEDLVAISNGEVESERYADGRKIVTFSPSPNMSSYLLAFIVGDLESVEASTKRGVVVRGWTTHGKSHLARYAVETSVKLLEYYEEYFGTEYPLPKLDLIAVPDFGAGAMENWGAITFRETYMLVDSYNCSREQLHTVTAICAHEIAHQWFGNLTTMTDWSGLYLNESFATYLGTKAVNHLHPEWNVWTQFVADECCNAMRLDGMRSTHPVEVPIPCSRDVDEIFDDISYDKGGSLLRMLETHIGEAGFRDGMRIYMLRNAYGSTRTRHLWEALEYATKKPVSELMTKWTDIPGYPVVTFTTERKKNDLVLRMTQNRFLYEGSGDDAIWNVPVRIMTGQGEFEHLLTERTGEMVIPDHFDAEHLPAWMHPNAGRAGFYRANVSESWHRRIMLALDARRLTAEERLGIEDDAFALCRAGMTDINRYRDTVSRYRGETEYAVWHSMLANLGSLMELLCDHHTEAGALRTFIGELTGDAVAKVGWQPQEGAQETSSQSMLRPLLLGSAGSCGNEDVLATAETLFAQALIDIDAVHPDVRTTVYRLAASHHDPEGNRLNQLMGIFSGTTSQEEQESILGAIGGATDVATLKNVYALIISSVVRPQNAINVLIGVRANPSLPAIYAWEFVKSHWPELKKRYESNAMMLGSFIKTATGALATQAAADDIATFFRDNHAEGLTKTVAQCVERIRDNARWLDRNLPLLTP